MDNLIFGYSFEQIKKAQQKEHIAQPIQHKEGDTGSDPLGTDKFKMIPSGDIVTYKERCERLSN